MRPTVLVATWRDGVFVLAESAQKHELAGQSVRGLAPDGLGGALAIVDGKALRRRSLDGTWSTLAAADCELSCCLAAGDAIYVGTDDAARLLRLETGGELAPIPEFERVEGRETWSAGQMLVGGKLVGPPLGVRSMAVTASGVLLANVHVGGIARSTDGGASFHPTIEVGSDVHEVRAHANRAELVVAAAAIGLCTSRDGGATWHIQSDGLHASYCSAVAFVGEEVWVAASEHHFSKQGRIYRRSVDDDAALGAVQGEGLPDWTDGIVDTHGIASSASHVAIADRAGNVYLSSDHGRSWSRLAAELSAPSSVLLA